MLGIFRVSDQLPFGSEAEVEKSVSRGGTEEGNSNSKSANAVALFGIQPRHR